MMFFESSREKIINKAINFVKRNRIQGDYVEFGVYRGDSLKMALRAKKKFDFEGAIIGYDSFRGLPHDEEEFKEGMFNCSKSVVQRRVGNEPILREGWFKDIEPIKKPIAVCMIDVDLYTSAKEVLDKICLQDGMIIIFDDWNTQKANPNKGERRAFREWVEKNNISYSHFWPFGWHGMSFIIHRGDE